MHLNACRQQKGHYLWSKIESTKKLRGHSTGRSRVSANTEESGHKQHKQNGHPSEQKDNKRVGKDTSWAQTHRVGTKSQRVQKDRVGTNTASSHKHKECAQVEWAETPTRDRERSKWHKPAGSTQTTQASRVDTSRVDTNTEWIKTWVDANTESGKIIWEDQAPKRIHTNSGQQLLQQQQKTDRQHACIRGSMTLPSYNLYNQELFVGLDVCTNSHSQQTLIIILGPFQSAEKCFCEESCKRKTFSTNSIENPDWLFNLNLILLPANQISETKLINKIKSGFWEKIFFWV